MLYADEFRSEEDINRAKAEAFVENPVKVMTNYFGLKGRYERLEVKYKKAEAQASQVREAQRAAQQAKAQQDDLKRRLADAHGALNAYRKENKKLKADLKRVRESRTMKVGKMVLWPVSFIRGVFSSAQQNLRKESDGELRLDREVGRTSEHAVPAESSNGSPAGVVNRGVADETALVTSAIPVASRTLDQLLDELRRHPSKVRFKRALNRLWFTEGSISASAALIEEFPEIVCDLDAKYRVQLDRILGAARLKAGSVDVPPRALGAAYVVEPGRVMYCVHQTPVYNSNGYSTRTMGVVEGLQNIGVDIFVAARAGYPWDVATDKKAPKETRSETVLNGVSYVHRPGTNLNRSATDHYILDAADAFVREARLRRPEIIQSASNHLTGLAALIAARRIGVPFIYEVRGLWEITEAASKPGWEQSERFNLAKHLETLVATEADQVLAITQQVADELVARGVPAEKIKLAKNSVNPSAFVPLPRDTGYADRMGIRTDVPVIGFAGSIVEYEGLALLLEASAALVERGVDHQVVIAGSGSAVESLKAMRDSLRLRTVRFVGRRPITEMVRLISTFDIMPCPRLSNAVTELVSPLKPLEAFACAKAVVLSDVAPHIDMALCAAGNRAELFEAGNVEALTNVLQKLIENDDYRATLGRRGRLWVLRERSWDVLAQDLRDCFESVRKLKQRYVPDNALPLSSLKVAVIADEFTSSTLAGTCQTVALSRMNWREQLAKHQFDLLFVESAWSGTDGEWRRGVGHYSEDESRDLRQILEAFRERGVPSVFWNKEDPVHFDRFVENAVRCDHVFTTDSDQIPNYLARSNGELQTASSLPFYAQPKIHNPLATKLPWECTVAYAGTYYGDRYRDRSNELNRMLDAAAPIGLAIFDRQMAIPDSPYKFPEKYESCVRGALPYEEVLEQYKAHVAHLNVNSVTRSPTMFSRRVVEIAASGGVVLSGTGRGITETIGDAIPTYSDPVTWRGLLNLWATDPEARLREAWRQMRAIYRSHLVDTAMVIVARTAGIPVSSQQLDTYALDVRNPSTEVLESIVKQSMLPTAIYVAKDKVELATRIVSQFGVAVIEDCLRRECVSDWIATVAKPVERTHFEDLLLCARFGTWSHIVGTHQRASVPGAPIARTIVNSGEVRSLESSGEEFELNRVSGGDGSYLELLVPDWSATEHDEAKGEISVHAEVDGGKPRTILFAGHDLKFAQGLISHLRDNGHEVLVDEWRSHVHHDEEHSRGLLAQADVVFCEWALGNAVWYSNMVKPKQKLIVRVHSQELRRPYLSKVKHDRVDDYIFVGELIRRAAVESHGVPTEKTRVIPNPVKIANDSQVQQPGREFNIGFVGMVPQSKRLDLALDLLERLHVHDSRYRLFIKGKRPAEYSWLRDRPDELAYYSRLESRIADLNARTPGLVQFDEYGDDMDEWYRKIGVAISVSDFESFHLTLADGAAAGSVPVSLLWPGADLIYPYTWLNADIEQMARSVEEGRVKAKDASRFVADAFNDSKVLSEMVSVMFE